MSAADPPRRPSIGRGIAWMLAANFLFACTDAVNKVLVAHYPVIEVVWGRYTLQGLFLLAVLNVRLIRDMATRRLGMQLVRSALLVVSTAFGVVSLRFIPLAEFAALMFLAPLFASALAIPLLGERVGPRRWAGIVVGLAGALLIVRPGTALFHWGVLLTVAGAFCYGIYQVATRALASEPPLTLLFYTTVVGAVATSALVPFEWVAPDAEGWLLLAAVGLFTGVGHFGVIKAIEAAPVATVAPFGYAWIVWSTLIGALAFGQAPDAWAFAGIGVIAASGLYVLRHEHAARARAAAADGP